MFDVDGMDVSSGLPQKPTAGPNQQLAQAMGIVMGTSHHEPMARNQPEWNTFGKGEWEYTKNAEVLNQFWQYGAERARSIDAETVFTVGMRGNGDLPLPGADIEILHSEWGKAITPKTQTSPRANRRSCAKRSTGRMCRKPGACTRK